MNLTEIVHGFIGWDRREVPIDAAIMCSSDSSNGRRWLQWMRDSWVVPGRRERA